MSEEIKILIEPHFAGDYRLEYDGKYLTLFGKDNTCDFSGLYGAPEGTYDERVLVPCVLERRNIAAEITNVNQNEITITIYG